jgi:hypothetical protein
MHGNAPYVDKEQTKWINPCAVSRLCNLKNQRTIQLWAERGRTSFGLRIESRQVPVVIGSRHNPRGRRTERLGIAEHSVAALQAVYQEVFGDKGRRRRGNFSKNEMAALEAATARYYRGHYSLTAPNL